MVARRLTLLVSLLAAALALTPAATARTPGLSAPARGANAGVLLQSSLVSDGAGVQTLNGGGLTYGTIARGGSIAVTDLSAEADMLAKLSSPNAKTRWDGNRITQVYRATGKRGLTFKVTGSHYKIVLNGVSTTLNGVAVYGRAMFLGRGSYSLSGGPEVLWAGEVSLGSATKPPRTKPKPSKK